jgi:hypothetical protein
MNKKYDLTYEQLSEALIKSKGFVLAAVKILNIEYGIDVSHSVVRARIKEWGMEHWIDELRKSLVESCLARTFHKAIQEGDNHCIFWVLQKYAHHVDFLGSKETESESKKGWKEILGVLKGSFKSETA